jgi:hypothetical protein
MSTVVLYKYGIIYSSDVVNDGSAYEFRKESISSSNFLLTETKYSNWILSINFTPSKSQVQVLEYSLCYSYHCNVL